MHLSLPQVSEPLRLWEKIEIVVGDDADKGLYLARIEDFIEDGIVISNPEFREGATLLRDNCEVVVLVVKEDAVYQFYSLLSKRGSGEAPVFVLTMPRDIHRVQRRQFVRIDVIKKVRIANLGAERIIPPVKWDDTVSINISGGGMLIKNIEGIEPPNILLVTCEIFAKLGIDEPLAAICRRAFTENHQDYAGVEFIRADNLAHHFYNEELENLPPTVKKFDHLAQNRLVTYVFQQQIDLRKKGLI